MNQSIVVWVLAAIIVIGGAIWIFAPNTFTSGGTATTTPAVTTTTQPSPTATPSAPAVTTGTLVVASNSSAVVTGKVTPDGSQTSYWYEYGRTSSLGARSGSQAIGSGFVSISAPAFITGLAPNTTYYYRLVAQNGIGTASGSTLSFTTNTNPPPVGSAPTTHTDGASSIARTNASLNGHVNPNGSDTSFWFEYGESSALGNTSSFQSAGAGTGSVSGSVSVSGLTPSTKYYFRIDAQNQFGTVNGAILTFTTNGPATPGAPSADTTSATSIHNTSATLNGTVNPNGDSTTYWFEYGSDSLLSTVLGSTTHRAVAGSGTSPISVSSPLDSLSPNTTYWYRVVSSNSYGTTDGDIVSFKTTPH